MTPFPPYGLLLGIFLVNVKLKAKWYLLWLSAGEVTLGMLWDEGTVVKNLHHIENSFPHVHT